MFEIRPDRQIPQGRRKLHAERAKYFDLLAGGYGYSEAARIVGVNYRTTKRWRSGVWTSGNKKKAATVAPAVARPYRPSSSSGFLSEQDRIVIADRLLARSSIRQIAQNAELRAHVQGKLDLRWSPEQIARTLRREFPDQPEMHAAHETIYLALYLPARGGLRRELHRALRTGRGRLKSRRQAQRRQPRYRDPMVMICDRPAEAASRAVPGHWEGDLIIGKNQKSAIATLVERSTRYTILVHFPRDHGAESVRNALVERIAELPTQLRRSLTWDQGSETGQHSPDLLARVANELNTRPRKALGWYTPAERFARVATGVRG